MRTREFCLLLLIVMALGSSTPTQAQSHYGIGRVATPAEVDGWNIDIGRNGENLPEGSGSVSHGHEIFDQQCAACHGTKGEGGVGDRLVGGQGTIATPKPIKTVGSFWPYAPTLFDYIRRAMPLNESKTLANDEVYALAAYLLQLNGVIGESDRMDAQTLPKVRMPNREGFVGFARGR